MPREPVVHVLSDQQVLIGLQPEPHDAPKAHLHCSSMKHGRLRRTLLCCSAANMSAERSAAALVYHLASRTVLSSEARHMVQTAEQSAQRSDRFFTQPPLMALSL